MNTPYLKHAMRSGCGLLLLLLSTLVMAARPTPPPLDLLLDPDVVVAEGSYADAPAPGRLRFVKVAALHGTAPPEVTVVAPYESERTLEVGLRYFLAYSERSRSPTEPRAWVRNPRGPTLLVKTGLEPGLLPATPAVRQLLMAARDRDYVKSRPYLRQVLKGLHSSDPSLQRLFAAELFGRTALRAQLRNSDRRQIRSVARDARSDPLAREYLLSAAQVFDPQLGRWWRQLALEILETEPVAPQRGARNEVLVWTAFGIVNSEQLAPALVSGERWMRSGNGALAEQALLTLRRVAPAREREALAEALAAPELDVQTRAFLLDHQRRLLTSTPAEH